MGSSVVYLASILDFSKANDLAGRSYSLRNMLLMHVQIQFHYTQVCSLTLLQQSIWSSKATMWSAFTGKICVLGK